jgi:PPOX class probable F420-dependent enzyme
MTATSQSLGAAPYVLVTTYRRDGRAVATPVWVVPDGEGVAVWTARDTGKVKRIRRDGTVLVGPCDFRGRLTGPQVPAHANILDGDGTARVRAALARKYGLAGRLTLWGSRLRRGLDGTVGIHIALVAPSA